MNNESRTMNNEQRTTKHNGFALPLVIVAVVILVALAVGLTMVSYGARIQAVRAKCETASMLAAEAGYEQGIFWMSQQADILSALQNGSASGTIEFENSSCTYDVQFEDYIGARAVFRIISTGTSGNSSRVVDVTVLQAINGWAMGKCRVPTGTTSTVPVYFADGEIIDVPVHINNLKDSPDERDIYIDGSPRFEQKVEMGESRKTSSNFDKYASAMPLFKDGIYFDQPDVRITDEAAVQSKVNRFRDSTNPLFRFVPNGTANVSRPRNAVQLEFFVEAGVGKVRITNNCTVRGYPGTTYDYKIVPGSGGSTYQKYDIYTYHYAPRDQAPLIVPVENTYVTQKFGTKESEPGGQIFVDGDVIIGSADFTDIVVKGKMTVVSSGNIWIADSVVVDGDRNADGLPADTNPNVLGLIAQGVVKIADPGLSNSGIVDPPVITSTGVPDVSSSARHVYRPVANSDGAVINNRFLPHTMIVEAAVTVGGGGWGTENVRSSSGRKVTGPGKQDFLILRGTLSESIRAVVGLINRNGYLKRYYLDKRLLEGILPGDIWFSGKYVPAPAGWHDYRPEN
ncbi:MAG: hypothetical protein ABII09_05805 [Planctomycetota bacterium]